MLSDKVTINTSPKPLLAEFFSQREYSKVGVLVDENTLRECYPQIQHLLPSHHLFKVPSGEENKTLETCALIWQQLTDVAFDRHSLLIVLGGGVLGDMGGFCAATYKRGIAFVLMPTTLLSQVDASIGGKLGIDFHHFKNHIGVFQEPACTLVATDFLMSLPLRELRSGFAEIIKHCLIADKQMWETIRQKAFENQDWKTLIAHSIEIKYKVTEEDPKEKGLRKILNFGHTVGHALETYFLISGNKLFHGEAIAIGMITESFIGANKGLISTEELSQITAYLISIFGKVILPSDFSEVLALVDQDKKNSGNKILIALPSSIGKAVWDVEITKAEIAESLSYYQTL